MPKLVLPHVKYINSFLRDFKSHDVMQDSFNNTGIPKSEVSKRFPEFIRKLKLQSKGIYSKPGLVPQTVYWLVEGKKYLIT